MDRSRVPSAEKCSKNVTELKIFLRSCKTIIEKCSDHRSDRLNADESLAEAVMFEKEGDMQDKSGETSLALACYTKAASLLKITPGLEDTESDYLLRIQTTRGCYLKKARDIYRKMLVESVQNPKLPVSMRSRRTRQVFSEKRACNQCARMVFWLKSGSCSVCDLSKSDGKKQLSDKTAKHIFIRDFIGPGRNDEIFVSPSHCSICSNK